MEGVYLGQPITDMLEYLRPLTRFVEDFSDLVIFFFVFKGKRKVPLSRLHLLLLSRRDAKDLTGVQLRVVWVVRRGISAWLFRGFLSDTLKSFKNVLKERLFLLSPSRMWR